MLFKKRLQIDYRNISYSQYYPSHNYDIVDPIYWFRVSNYKIYDGEELIKKGVFKNAEELSSSGDYIPFAKSDVTQAEKDFVEQFCPEEKSELEKIRVTDSDCEGDYDIAFRIFIEVHPLRDEWDYFSIKRLEDDIVAWCEKNNIRYIVK